MRRAVTILLLAIPIAGCGDDDPRPAQSSVRLAVTAPADSAIVDSDAVTLEGTVAPRRAEVRVLGEVVGTSGGRFSTEIELEPGANVVDVSASADGHRADVAAIRVVRRMPVQIPVLEGAPLDQAVDQLETLGLEVEVERGGSLLDELLGGEARVCGTDPGGGETVKPGTGVRVVASPGC